MRTRISIAALLVAVLFAGIAEGQSKPSQAASAITSATTMLNATEAQKSFRGQCFSKARQHRLKAEIQEACAWQIKGWCSSRWWTILVIRARTRGDTRLIC